MTDNDNANTIGDLFRSLGGVLNNAVYFLLGIMYQIFFNVASAQLFETETIKNFYGRVQLIVGVFMVFKLAVSILQGIINPDQFSNPKEGFGNFITRVVVALALFTVLMPINVPDVENANSYEKYLNNNGLLFGTLYSLQDRILSGNTLGRLILGTTDGNFESDLDTSGMSEEEAYQEKLGQSSRIFASTILKGFLRINLKPEELRENDLETSQENWYCEVEPGSENADLIKGYTQLDVEPSTLLSGEVLKADCNIGDWLAGVANNTIFDIFVGNSRYLFSFSWILSFFVGIGVLILFVLFTVDIAIRSIKLSILRLIAPIPIISYIDPKSSKDGGAFSSWVKSLTSTYLDLFLRLAIIYFVIFLIQDIITNGIIINDASGMVGIFSFIFIIIGLLIFAKMAPKFIKDALGVKGGGLSNFGLGYALAAAGAVRQGGTIAEALEAGNDATRAGIQAFNQGKPAPGLGDTYNSGRDYVAKILTGDQNMSGRRMSRGERHLKRMDINTERANTLKNAMYAAQNEATSAKDFYDRFNQGKLSKGEFDRFTDQHEDFGAAVNAYMNRGYSEQDAQRQVLEDRMYAAQTKAGKAKSAYEDVAGMQKVYGQSRSYEAQYEGDEERYFAFRNRTLRGLGRSSQRSKVQLWRTQNYDGATGSTTPRDSGVDFTPPGSMGEGGPPGP